jgi:hypothetical protein
MTEPRCSRCGEKKRLIQVSEHEWVCEWQGGCDHRVMQQEARLREMWDQVADFLRAN